MRRTSFAVLNAMIFKRFFSGIKASGCCIFVRLFEQGLITIREKVRMKRLALILGTTIAAAAVTAAPTSVTNKPVEKAVETKKAEASVIETPVAVFNKKGYGTISGRLQSVTMYRDYDNGLNAYSSSLGIILKYVSPEMAGVSIGAAYNGAGVLNSMDYGNVGNPGEVSCVKWSNQSIERRVCEL